MLFELNHMEGCLARMLTCILNDKAGSGGAAEAQALVARLAASGDGKHAS